MPGMNTSLMNRAHASMRLNVTGSAGRSAAPANADGVRDVVDWGVARTCSSEEAKNLPGTCSVVSSPKIACWSQMPEIEHYNVSAAAGDYFRCALTPRDGLDLRPQIFALARDRGWQLRELTRSRHTLEDIYVHLTNPEEET